MNQKFYLGNNVMDFESYDTKKPISKIRLYWSDSDAFEAGDDTGSTMDVFCPYATQEMANNLLAEAKGFRHVGFRASGAILPDNAELGDGTDICGIYAPLEEIVYVFDPDNTAEIAAPGEKETTSEFKGSLEREVAEKVTLGVSYYGTSISRKSGLAISKIAANGEVKSRVVLNSDVQAFYNDNGEEALYFDINAGKFRFQGDVAISGGTMNISDNFVVDGNGNVTVNGNINLSNGTITWGKNNPADGSGISASQARTIISEELVSSPNIAGGKFLDLSMGNWIEMGEIGTTTGYLNHYADNYSTTEPVCVMGYYNPNGNKSWVLAPFGDIILEKSSTRDKVFISGEWDFSYATVVGAYLRFS